MPQCRLLDLLLDDPTIIQGKRVTHLSFRLRR
jgi:hypothetical protein